MEGLQYHKQVGFATGGNAAGNNEWTATEEMSDTPPTGVGGLFNVTSDNAACALRAATPSPDRSLVFYVAQ